MEWVRSFRVQGVALFDVTATAMAAYQWPLAEGFLPSFTAWLLLGEAAHVLLGIETQITKKIF